MSGKILHQEFFNRKTLTVAKELLGIYLVRQDRKKTTAFKIIEVEAYIGPHDLASHVSKGMTKRNAVMFGSAGTFYIYFVYGMHWMLNVVTEREKYPAAILIRGVEGVPGPGRVTKLLKIDGKFNGLAASKKTRLWFEDRGERPRKIDIEKTARIGVSYAGEIWANKPYRFVLKKN